MAVSMARSPSRSGMRIMLLAMPHTTLKMLPDGLRQSGVGNGHHHLDAIRIPLLLLRRSLAARWERVVRRADAYAIHLSSALFWAGLHTF